MHRNVSAKLPAYIGDMANLNRRSFLTLTGAAGLSAALDIPAFGQPNEASAKATSVRDFTFLFITDTHLEPELNAAQGCDQCFKKARTIKSDFAIQGGDHVFDSLLWAGNVRTASSTYMPRPSRIWDSSSITRWVITIALASI